MKRISSILLASLLVALCFKAQAAETTGTIEIILEGFKNDKGRVAIALFKSADGFPNAVEKIFKAEMNKIKDAKSTVVFNDIPYGEYAFAVLHDENENGKMDYSFGIPQEGYAFSNNAKGTLGPPEFEKAKFKLDRDKVSQTILLIN